MSDSIIIQENVETPQITKNSTDTLHKITPSEDISIKSLSQNIEEKPKQTSEISQTRFETPEIEQPSEQQPTKIETVYETVITTNATESIMATQVEDIEIKSKIDVTSEDNLTSSKSGNIFSVKGSPSGRIPRRRDLTSVFPVGCMGCKEEEYLDCQSTTQKEINKTETNENLMTRRPSSAAHGLRNPLTGAGFEDEGQRRISSKKKDGNPLLGTGYADEENAPQGKGRVPPGGYSQGLW